MKPVLGGAGVEEAEAVAEVCLCLCLEGMRLDNQQGTMLRGSNIAYKDYLQCRNNC